MSSPSASPQSPLAGQVAARILALIAEDGLAAGARLPERALAERLRVSRSPVRGALQLLAERGAVAPADGGGYAVAASDALTTAGSGGAEEDGERIYFAIAADRLEGRLPDRVSENELMRRYGLPRGELTRLLQRIAGEGWLERLPGHGWAFAETLSAGGTLEQSYRFRIEIEPAALLLPSFMPDRAGLERCRAQQQALLDGAIERASPADLFEANTLVHETLIACSGNPFFLDALRRINRLRRLVAYRRITSRRAGESQCAAHIAIIDAVLAGEREGAAAGLREHLEASMVRRSE